MVQNHTFFLLIMLVFLTSCCILTINNVQSRGTADDVVDNDPVNDIKPSANFSIPVKGI